jgi:hypothetical protein
MIMTGARNVSMRSPDIKEHNGIRSRGGLAEGPCRRRPLTRAAGDAAPARGEDHYQKKDPEISDHGLLKFLAFR